MPVTLLDRLPLPNLKVYTAGSVLLLSIATYYALSATNDPNWRVNITQSRQDVMVEVEGESKVVMAAEPVQPANITRNVSEQFVDVVTFMIQEPLCMWTLINVAYCSLALFGVGIQRVVFGELRVAEAQRVKDKFWNYVFYKFIFVFGVINVQYMDEVLLWCCWFTLVGFLHLMGQLCKDRYEYLTSSSVGGGWAQARLAALAAAIVVGAGLLLALAASWTLPASPDTFAFMAAECVLVVVAALHVGARYALQLRRCDVAGPAAYYTHLAFDCTSLVTEAAHVVHMVAHSRLVVSMASLVLLLQLRHLLHELQARLRRHRLYAALANHMSKNYPMASKEEVAKNQDNCAICWEPMKEARKLPCSHLFHNSCLCQWVQQDASCPTCRRALHVAHRNDPRVHHHNQLFHFDGSRYVSWLPSFSVEVSRGVGVPEEVSAAQLAAVFPQYSVGALAAELARVPPEQALDNILEGRLTPTRTPADVVAPPATSTTSTDAPDRRHAALGLHLEHEHHEADTSSSFSENAVEREIKLARRKELLIASARRRYLERIQHRPAPSASAPARADSPAHR